MWFEPYGFVGAVVAVAAIAWIVAIRRDRTWRVAAERLGFRFERSLIHQRIEGMLDGHAAGAAFRPGEHGNTFQFHAGGVPSYLTVRGSAVGGPEALTFGLLDERLRDEIAELAGSRVFSVANGEVTIVHPRRVSLSAGEIEAEVRRVVSIAARLAERAKRPLAQRLLDLAEHDRSPEVRWKALALLIAHTRGPEIDRALACSGETLPLTAMTKALHDPASAVRVAAVDALGEIGGVDLVPVLRAEATIDPGLAPHVEDAIRKIQARAAGQEGSLALAEAGDEQGALSPVARGGEVALVKGKT